MTFHKALLGKVLLASFASGILAASALPVAARAGEVYNRGLARNGGHLTAHQKVQLNRELNHNSARIYRTKHN